MARNDDWDRVVGERSGRSSHRSRAAGRRSDLAIGRALPVADVTHGRFKHVATEAAGERKVDGKSEGAPAAGEVLVKLAAHVVEPLRVGFANSSAALTSAGSGRR